MQAAMMHLQAEGTMVLVPPEPGEAFENEPFAFTHINGLPVEIIATDKKAQLIARDKESEI
jgi:hypothetical protein